MASKKTKNLIYIVIFLLPFFLFFTRAKSLTPLKFTVVESTSPIIRILSFPLKELKKILYYHRTFEEYKRLNDEVGLLKSRMIGLEEVILENRRLEQLLEFKRRLVYSSVVADVIGRNPSSWDGSLIIDKGLKDGITEGAPVVNAFGVIGKIVEVGASSSKVILLTDPQFSVAALAQRTRETGVVSGTLGGLCRMRYIDENAQIRVGDNIITSKLSSSFPEGLSIGEVVKIDDKDQNGSRECSIKPSVSFSQMEEVLIILK